MSRRPALLTALALAALVAPGVGAVEHPRTRHPERGPEPLPSPHEPALPRQERRELTPHEERRLKNKRRRHRASRRARGKR